MKFVDRVRVEEGEGGAEGIATAVAAAAAGAVAVAGVVVVEEEVAASTRLLKPLQRIWSCRTCDHV